ADVRAHSRHDVPVERKTEGEGKAVIAVAGAPREAVQIRLVGPSQREGVESNGVAPAHDDIEGLAETPIAILDLVASRPQGRQGVVVADGPVENAGVRRRFRSLGWR